jgi:hypothetical protein
MSGRYVKAVEEDTPFELGQELFAVYWRAGTRGHVKATKVAINAEDNNRLIADKDCAAMIVGQGNLRPLGTCVLVFEGPNRSEFVLPGVCVFDSTGNPFKVEFIIPAFLSSTITSPKFQFRCDCMVYDSLRSLRFHVCLLFL